MKLDVRAIVAWTLYDFHSLCGKGATVMGPLVLGTVSHAAANSPIYSGTLTRTPDGA